MPNWCENDLNVRGPKEALVAFQEAVKGTDWHGEEKLLCEDKIIPYPEHFRLLDMANPMMEERKELSEEAKQRLEGLGYDLARDGFNQGGYEWCQENLGYQVGILPPGDRGDRGGGNPVHLRHCLESPAPPDKEVGGDVSQLGI